MAATAQHVQANRETINWLGLNLFIASESMLFLALAASRFYLLGVAPIPGANEFLGALLTILLLGSSFLGYRSSQAIARGDRAGFTRNLLLTILLGALFILGVAYEWSTAEITLRQITGTVFFTLTGLHVLHLLSGLVALVLIYRLGTKGHFSAEAHWGVTGAIRYWTFVDLMWIIIVYPLLYLI